MSDEVRAGMETDLGVVKPPPHRPSWTLPLLLMGLTFLSATYIGAAMAGVDLLDSWDFAAGAPFSLPLMAILLAHEFGHYLAARKHGVPTSPPYFIPMPFFKLGTMGAIIVMRGRIRRRDALLDIGAAGPLAGLIVALPVLIYGLISSPVTPLPADQPYEIEGRSLLYIGLLRLLKGPIPEGHDIFLSGTALAGWAGLFITMINLLPIGQLDGGHIAYALFDKKQIAISRRMRSLLPLVGLGITLFYGLSAYAEGKRGDALLWEFSSGVFWITWWLVLSLLVRLSRGEHPPTDPGALSAGRRLVAVFTLGVFILVFTPTFMRLILP
jgi:membrane-associated protease RseP (regulator of RpoE activity)